MDELVSFSLVLKDSLPTKHHLKVNFYFQVFQVTLMV